MIDSFPESSNWRRYLNYCTEVRAINRKLNNRQVPDEKRRRLGVRLKDIQGRLIPNLIASFQVVNESVKTVPRVGQKEDMAAL